MSKSYHMSVNICDDSVAFHATASRAMEELPYESYEFGPDSPPGGEA